MTRFTTAPCVYEEKHRQPPELEGALRSDNGSGTRIRCGKSTTALSILGLLPSNNQVSGTIDFGGRNLVDLPPRELRRVRGNEISMIFQEPMTSLNPNHRIGRQIGKAIRYHQRLSKAAARALARTPKARQVAEA